MNEYETRWAPWAFSFTLPSGAARAVDMSQRDFWHLSLAALQGMSAGVATLGIQTAPVGSIATVTDVGVTLALATTKPRRVSIFNNSTFEILISESDLPPGFSGQSAPGVLTADQGVKVLAGGYFESPVAHIGIVRARTNTGNSAQVTVTKY